MSLRHNLKLLSRKLTQALRVMMPSLFVLAFASVAHAQGTMDFSGAQTLMGTFKKFPLPATFPFPACGAQFVDMANPLTNTSVLWAKRRP